MRAFLLVTLTDVPIITYQQPVLQWLKQESKDSDSIAVLDIDAFSDEALVNYACKLMQESEVWAVYFKIEKEDVALGAGLKIVEEIIRGGKAGLVLLEGKHQRLSTIFSSRPEIDFKAAESEAGLKHFIKAFLDNAD